MLAESDRKLIEGQEFIPGLVPRFDALKACLIWEDELPRDITPDGYKFLCDLWVARAHLYHGNKLDEKLFNPSYYVRVWNWALEQKIQWPGFQRLVLSEENRAKYKECLSLENPFE